MVYRCLNGFERKSIQAVSDG